MPSFAQAVVITGTIRSPTELEQYLLSALIREDKSANDRATNMSIRGNVKLFRWFEDEETSDEFMSHRLRNLLPYGMAEMMRP